jgi:hypothetical protein
MKGVHIMWGMMTQSGLATASVDFTNTLSVLNIGLLGSVVLLAGMITVSALRYSWSQTVRQADETTSAPEEYRYAA